MIRERRSSARGDEGSALVLALLFLTVCAVTIGGLLTFANSNSTATTALRSNRNDDFDNKATMEAAIATVRPGIACAPTGTSVYTPATSNLNDQARALRVDCFGLTSLSGQRNDVLLVCPISGSGVPCTDGQSVLRVNVIFYDTPSTGSSLGIQTWSNS